MLLFLMGNMTSVFVSVAQVSSRIYSEDTSVRFANEDKH